MATVGKNKKGDLDNKSCNISRKKLERYENKVRWSCTEMGTALILWVWGQNFKCSSGDSGMELKCSICCILFSFFFFVMGQPTTTLDCSRCALEDK